VNENIKYLQGRLVALSTGKRLTWTLDDRAAVSALLNEFRDAHEIKIVVRDEYNKLLREERVPSTCAAATIFVDIEKVTK